MSTMKLHRQIRNYLIGLSLILVMFGVVLQVIIFNYDISNQMAQSEYESALEEYAENNIYYSPGDVVQYVRIRQNPSGYFVLNPDLVFEPSEYNLNTLKATRFSVITLNTLNQTSAINENATVNYVMSNYENYSTPEGTFTGFSKYEGYSAGIRSTCDALMTLEALDALDTPTLDLNSVEQFILHHQNLDGGFWDDDYPQYGTNSTLLATSFAMRSLGRIYQFQGREFNETIKEMIAEFVTDCFDESDAGYANEPGTDSTDSYGVFRAFISLWWLEGSDEASRRSYIDQNMDLGSTVSYLSNNLFDNETGAFYLNENDGFDQTSLKSTHLMVWFFTALNRDWMLNVTALGHYLMSREVTPGQYGPDIYSTYAAVLTFVRLGISTEPLPVPTQPALVSLEYLGVFPFVILSLGIISMTSAYYFQHNAIKAEQSQSEYLEREVEKRTKELQMEIRNHEKTRADLEESECRYRRLFEDSPLSLWVEDYSGAKKILDDLVDSGVTDLRTHLSKNEEVLLRCADAVQILDVNQTTLTLHGLSNKNEIIGPVSQVLNRDSLPVFLDQILALHSGQLSFESEIENLLVSGTEKALILKLSVLPENEDTLSRVLLTIIDITVRKRAEERVAASLAEKELLLKEIHHRVKNNMQIISSLLHLQSSRIVDTEAALVLRESEHRVKSMAMIHEALYRSDDLARIDFEKYIHDLTRNILLSFGSSLNNVSLNVNIKEKYLDIAIAIPCALIINELVSNSVKHAFPDDRPGEITISFIAVSEDIMELSVSDNGIGVPDDFDLKESESLGLKLVTRLAERQLNGALSLELTDKTKYMIRFKRGGI